MRATAIATTATLWLSGIASIAPLSVAREDVTCNGGSFIAQFSPRVTFKNETTQVSASGDLGVCQSFVFPYITGGEYNFVGTSPGGCPSLFPGGYGRLQIKWSDGSNSTVPRMYFRAEATSWSFQGPVEGGKFVVAIGRIIFPLSEIEDQCAASGLTHYVGALDTLVLGDI